jgi:hypothetical protein
MSKIVKIFNELIQHKLSPVFGNSLLECKLVDCGYGYRYDLIFVFRGEYNNPMIQFESVLETCDMLFDWFDLRDMVNLSIAIITEFGRTRHFSYFELMDELCRGDSYYHHHYLTRHPKYRQYQEWKSNKELDERVKRAWEKETLMKEKNTSSQESRKKKFLFW